MALLDLWQQPWRASEQACRPSHWLRRLRSLADRNSTPQEFRDLLTVVPSDVLHTYADQCLAGGFSDNGLALQDVVNEAGRRLGFDVESGLYRGRPGASGHDGIWRGKSGHAIVVDVKTTTAYRIDLDTVAGYRTQLEESGAVVPDRGSILLVVGREETQGLEAQIRGSRYAWDMRMMSMDALFDLVTIRERLNDPATQAKIHDILTPGEYTRVDSIVELVFSTNQDVDLASGGDEPASDSDEAGNARTRPAQFNAACIDRIERARGWQLLRQSRTTWTSADGFVGIVCVVSREHDVPRHPNYWFSSHPYQHDALNGVSAGCRPCGQPRSWWWPPWT
jgi:hypothetical protein